MTGRHVASVRLAAPGSLGSNLYNSYQILAQVAALYVKARAGEGNAQYGAAWTWLADSALSDLGAVVNLWQSQTRGKSHALGPLDQPQVTARISRLCRRIELFEARFSLWTGTGSYFKALLVCEKHVCRLFNYFSELSPEIAPSFESIIESSLRRLDKIERMHSDYLKNLKSIDDKYFFPVTLSVAS